MRQRLWSLVGALMLLATAPAARGHDGPELPEAAMAGFHEPLALRNTFPVAQLFGLPRAQGAALPRGGTRVDLRVEHASLFTSSFEGATAAFFDGETTVTSLTVRRGLGARAAWGMELPTVMHSGGFLDDFLDDVHDLIGTGDAGRARARRDRTDFLLREGGVTYVDFDSRRAGVGDPRLWLGYQLLQDRDRSLALRGGVKLPVGKVSDLTGSGALDAHLTLEYAGRGVFDRPGFGFSVMAGAVYLGRGDLAPDAQQRLAVTGHLGVQYRWRPGVALKAQLDGHSRLFDAAVDQLGGGAVQGSLGARLRMGRQSWLDVAVIEDLISQTTADVIFQLGLGARF